MSVLGFEAWQLYTVETMPDYEGKLELVDGRLEVSPPAQGGHWVTASLLVEVLTDQLRPEYLVGAEVGMVLNQRNYRQPDVGVVRRDAEAADRWFLPQQVQLAVEIVSESSLTTDRITKPAQYARAGIQGYWRIETDPDLSLTAYVLEPGADVYTELGTWGLGETVTVDRPFAVTFDLDDLQA
jgi:Uma2 family endonuclease